MPLLEGLLNAAVRLLANGHSITAAAAESLGVSRQSLYRAAKSDPKLRVDMRRNDRPDEGDPAPWPQDDFDDRGGLTSVHDKLTHEQVGRFTKALRQTRRIHAAARAAGVDMYPNRIRWDELSATKRQMVRDFLAKMDAPDPDPVVQTKAAFENWLADQGWPADAELDVDTLRELSSRALDDYRRHRLVRAAEAAAHRGDGE